MRRAGRQWDEGCPGARKPVSSRWLRAHGYPGNLVARYGASGWLQSPTRGAYLRKGGTATWEGLLHSLQSLEKLAIHAGGRFALAQRGHEHYLRLGESATLTLYGTAKLPAWARKLPLPERIQACGRGPFEWPPLSFGAAAALPQYKAKRLFLALAERHRHAWLPHVKLQDVDLGRGKRVLVRGGKLNTKYDITLPVDLDEQLG